MVLIELLESNLSEFKSNFDIAIRPSTYFLVKYPKGEPKTSFQIGSRT